MHGSTTTRVPVATRAPGPGLDDAARGLVPEDEGEGADGGQGGRRPRVVGEQVEVAAADAPGRDGDPGPRRARELGLGELGQRGGELGVHHVEHDGAHGVSVGAAGRTAHVERRWPKVPADAGPRRHPRRGARARLLAAGGLPRARGAGGAPRTRSGSTSPGPRTTSTTPTASRGSRRASSPAWRSSPTARGTSTAWPSTPTSSTRPSATSRRPSSISTRWSCGPSTPAPSTTTSRCTATTAATASSCRAPSRATSS